MAGRPKLFVRLWESRFHSRNPLVFFFTHDGNETRWRCFGGPVQTIQRSRVYMDRAPVYGIAAAEELSRCGEEQENALLLRSRSRLLRRRLIARANKPALVPEVAAVGSAVEMPVAVAARASDTGAASF